MIDDRSKYEFVLVPSDMLINGAIMPVRIDKRQLRGEDICFCLELWRRMQSLSLVDSYNFKYAMDKQISGFRIQQIIDWIHQMGLMSGASNVKPIQPDARFDSRYVFDLSQSSGSTCPGILAPGNIVTDSDLISNRDNFEPGQPVDSTYIGYLFQDIAKMRRFQMLTFAEYNFGYVYSWRTKTAGDQSYFHDWTNPTWPYLYKFRAESYQSGSQTLWAQKRWTMVGGSFQIPIDRDKMRFIQRSARLFVPFTFVKRWYYNNDFESKNLHKMYVYPIQCSASGNNFLISSSDVANIVETIKNENNFPESGNINSGSPSADGSSGIWDASISIDTPNWMVCNLLDFNWE